MTNCHHLKLKAQDTNIYKKDSQCTKISYQEAMEKAEKEFEIYRDREMKQLESDFDKMIKMLKDTRREKIVNCFICKGDLEEKKVNYVVDLENTIIIIKGVPAKVCTQCGEQYFDDEIAENIKKIVNQLKQLAAEVTIVNYQEKVA